jgi:hypothetical protein
MRQLEATCHEVTPRENDQIRRESSRRAKNSLLENGFTPIPRVIDNMAIELAKLPTGRHVARVLLLVIMDLARFTDTRHGDVVVTNHGIAERRGIGLPAVKATIRLLRESKVLRKTEPRLDRYRELKEMPGGFDRNRRYLVWNPQTEWQIPETTEGLSALVMIWNHYVGKGNVPENGGY